MPISQMFLYLWENKVRPFFINDAKNHRNRLNHSCRKTRFKNITNAQINRLLFVFVVFRITFVPLLTDILQKLNTTLTLEAMGVH